jgi:hypothetical protein
MQYKMPQDEITQDEITIESGVPMPDPSPGRKTKYPFARMKVGDSFVVRLADTEHVKVKQGTLRSAATTAAKAHGHRYALRTLEENGNPVIRVWRTQ